MKTEKEEMHDVIKVIVQEVRRIHVERMCVEVFKILTPPERMVTANAAAREAIDVVESFTNFHKYLDKKSK
jgi:hypothetical protein